MELLYFNLVKAKLRTCNKNNTDIKLVPENLLDAVLSLLQERGFDADGNPIQ